MKNLFLLLLFLGVSFAAQAQVLLKGVVREAETGVSLAAAHVVLEGTTQGTITNREGRFELVVPSLPAALRVRYIGYRTQRVTAETGGARTLDIDLEPAVYELDEIFVAGEDFAANVMRKVIERKQTRQVPLKTVQARGYTRITLENAMRIALISETVFDRSWDRDRGPREVVRSRRETADFYRALQIEPARDVPNLYDDHINIQGLRFIGPTHPDALDYYTFSLAARRGLDDQTVYDIYIAPRTGLEATFIGRLSILDESYAMLEADLRPARHVVFPLPVEAWDVFYRQQFDVVADSFWLPVDLRLEGTIRVDPGGIGHETVTYQQISQLSAYQVNVLLPGELFARTARVTEDSLSIFKDDLFLLGRNIVPLTPREAVALEVLEHEEMTLERAFPPRGMSRAMAAFESRRNEIDGPQFAWPIILGYEPWLRFNRVDGYFLGLGQTLPFSPNLEAEWRAAEPTGLHRIRFRGRLTYRSGPRLTIEGRYARDISRRNASTIYPIALNTIPALLGQADYFDYYWSEGGTLRVGYAFPLFRVAVEGRMEKHDSVEREVGRSWPFSKQFRPNPTISEGRLRSLRATLAAGDGYAPFRFRPLRRIEVRLEHSSPGVLGSDFDFTRFEVLVDGYLKTFFPSRPRPNGLDVRIYGGTFRGTLPAQRFGVLDGSLGAFSTLGTFRSVRERPYEGERFLGVFWEHDFRTVPFEALGLRALVDRGTGLRLFGGHGRTWIAADRLGDLAFVPRYQDHFHQELGVSLTNVWGTPLRLDFTTRLDRPGFYVGFGLSRLF